MAGEYARKWKFNFNMIVGVRVQEGGSCIRRNGGNKETNDR